MAVEKAQAQDPAQQPQFTIEKIYVKDLSLEVPNAPQVFLERESPKVDIQLGTRATPLEEGHYEVVLTVTSTAKLGEKTVFLIEAHQAGEPKRAHPRRARSVSNRLPVGVLLAMAPHDVFHAVLELKLALFQPRQRQQVGIARSRHRFDCRIQVAMLLSQLGQFGARGDLIGTDNARHAFFPLRRLLATSSPQRFMSGQL